MLNVNQGRNVTKFVSETGFEPAFADKGATPITDNRLGNELGYSDLVKSSFFANLEVKFGKP